jgi:hypothetical protein
MIVRVHCLLCAAELTYGEHRNRIQSRRWIIVRNNLKFITKLETSLLGFPVRANPQLGT